METEKHKLTEREKVSIEKLKQGKIWTNWTYVTKGEKKTKVPTAKVNAPNTWITYAEAEANVNMEWSNVSGIGIMFARNKQTNISLCGIDIDAHNVDTNPLAKEIMDMFHDTYIEKSPSGKGFHILFFTNSDRLPTEKEYKENYLQKNSALDVECYISGMTNRYFTFTGVQVSDNVYVTNQTETLLQFLNRYMKKKNTTQLELTVKLFQTSRR